MKGQRHFKYITRSASSDGLCDTTPLTLGTFTKRLRLGSEFRTGGGDREDVRMECWGTVMASEGGTEGMRTWVCEGAGERNGLAWNISSCLLIGDGAENVRLLDC